MISKEMLLEAINRLPEKFSIDDFLDELMVIQKIEKGLQQSKNDEVISDDDLEKQLPEWLK